MPRNTISFNKTRKSVKNTKRKSYLGIPYYVILFGLIVLPFIIMMLYAFSETNEGIFNIRFTLSNFTMFFIEKSFVRTMFESLYIAALATIATLFIAYPLAYLITTKKKGIQVLLISLITATMWVNLLISANALKQITEMFFPSLLGTNFILILGNVYIFLPYMVLPIYTVLSKLDKSLIESSYDLGANNIQTFVKVILPLSLSGVVTGSMMVFLPAATTLVIPKYLGDGKRTMIGNLIEDAVLLSHNYGYGAAVSIVIGLILVGFIILLKKVDKYEGGFDYE